MQRRTLEALIAHERKHGHQPSYRELCLAIGVGKDSTASVLDHLRGLQARGYVSLSPGRSRSVTVLRNPDGTPVVDTQRLLLLAASALVAVLDGEDEAWVERMTGMPFGHCVKIVEISREVVNAAERGQIELVSIIEQDKIA